MPRAFWIQTLNGLADLGNHALSWPPLRPFGPSPCPLMFLSAWTASAITPDCLSVKPTTLDELQELSCVVYLELL
jgi:hypothetical protein